MRSTGAGTTAGTHPVRAQCSRRVLPVVLTGLLVLVLAVLGVPAAVAHTELTGATPGEGQVLAQAPATVTLSFNEPVGASAETVQVHTPAGDPVAAQVQALDTTVTLTPATTLGPGTHTVVWRVISADGHPISGSFTFSVGAPSTTTVVMPDNDPLPRAMIAAQTVTYLGVFAAAGLVVFELLVLPAGPGVAPATRRRLHRLAYLAAAVAALGAVASVLAAARWQEAISPGPLTDPILAAALTVAGVLAAAVAVPHATGGPGTLVVRGVALAGAAVAALSLVVTGHTRSTEPGWLVVTADAAHVAAGITWVGGLLGLAIVLGRASGIPAPHAATALARFSAAAAWTVAAVAATGLILAWRILGNVQGLVSTGYGQLLLIKVLLVLLVVLVAGWNRYVLLPRVLTSNDTSAAGSLRSAIHGEAVVLSLVLLITGVLTSLSP
ncbi:copper resistance protein CopC [Kocuria sp. CPCC 205263]|uniref:copper resistance CopC/CopD family protein n=1 Tax=Kocuria sp. CPCC 205263 TaxID=3073555 RepID=UPI0034D6E656